MIETQHYARLTMFYDGKSLSIVAAARVDGPLNLDPDLTGAMVYEAMLDGRRIGVGAFPDPRPARSLGESDGAHREPVVRMDEAFDFALRLPGDAVGVADLDDLQVVIYLLEKPDFFAVDVKPREAIPLTQAATDAGHRAPEALVSQTGNFLNADRAVTVDALESVLGR